MKLNKIDCLIAIEKIVDNWEAYFAPSGYWICNHLNHLAAYGEISPEVKNFLKSIIIEDVELQCKIEANPFYQSTIPKAFYVEWGDMDTITPRIYYLMLLWHQINDGTIKLRMI